MLKLTNATGAAFYVSKGAIFAITPMGALPDKTPTSTLHFHTTTQVLRGSVDQVRAAIGAAADDEAAPAPAPRPAAPAAAASPSVTIGAAPGSEGSGA